MLAINKVVVSLVPLPVSEGLDDEILYYCGEKALNWVYDRLRDGVDDDDPLVLETVTAMAQYFLFTDTAKSVDGYDTYSVGDLTFRRNCERELKAAERKRDTALAYAARILKDGEFSFASV